MCCPRITHSTLSKVPVNTDLGPQPLHENLGLGWGLFHKCPEAFNAHPKAKTTAGPGLLCNRVLQAPVSTCASQPQIHLSGPPRTCTTGTAPAEGARETRRGTGAWVPHPRTVSIPLSVLSALLLPLPPSLSLSGQPALPHGGFFWHTPGEGGFPVSSVNTT